MSLLPLGKSIELSKVYQAHYKDCEIEVTRVRSINGVPYRWSVKYAGPKQGETWGSNAFRASTAVKEAIKLIDGSGHF